MSESQRGRLLLEDAAHDIVGRMPADLAKDATFDPITILMIISVIISMIRVIQECRKNAHDVRGLAENLDEDNDRQIRKEIRKYLGIRGYHKYGHELRKAVINYGKTADESVFVELFEQVG